MVDGAPKAVDDYIAGLPAEVRPILVTLRATIKNQIPEAVETLRYGMPTFVFGREIVVHFGAFKTHIGLYPPVRDPELNRETEPYCGEKGNLRFPLSQPIPYALITRIVRARIAEIRAKAAHATPRRGPG